jgi:uncharacterized protein YlxW (UPF0749 family)
MKTIPAIIAALVVTLVLGFAMIAIGGDALANTNSVPVLNSPDQNTAAVSGSALDTQVADLQALVQQYQARENQYKTELDQAATRIKTAETKLATDEQVLQALQQRGLIRIDANGQIFLRRGD